MLTLALASHSLEPVFQTVLEFVANNVHTVGLEDIKQCQFPPSHIQLALFAPDACIHLQYTCVCDLGNIECVLFCSFFLPTLVVMEDSQEQHGECGNIHSNCA